MDVIVETKENEFENSMNSVHVQPARTPLNSIQDPSQYQEETRESDFDSREKHEATGERHRSSDRRIEGLDSKTGNGNNSNPCIPRTSSRQGKAQPELHYVQSTPGRSGARVSLGGGCSSGARGVQCNGVRGVISSSRISRGIPVADFDLYTEAPHFEFDEDPSYWTDHNVQVLIRMRPLNTMEKVSQGYGRCLKQESAHTLVWLGNPETRFTFDHIACESISQEKLFRVAGLPMVENCMSGYNSCMFAYGQTGSGKTYTMMGEIFELQGKLTEDSGITPRIFEYLFSRIRMEEESRRDEKLQFSCKCSFLEIYNEQITDLLEPSSINLQLREELKKGVYVENLTECNVRTVNDVLKLLLQGAANRKIAATQMNGESSRSHSVFTCIIESRWEKDSMTHFRFARLNLVDLAGSERQKSSGAEGDRLKEAANINKSLSTLGLVIMSLVDLAHGKQRHVPYRDSRLTFLLQDSLGGNSKTMIIANVSPSICSASETLSTLKFAQRAKLIQNNAKVNEDASGDVTALQREIQHLKGQLSSLMKLQNCPRSLSTCGLNLEESRLAGYSDNCRLAGHRITDGYHYQMHSLPSKNADSIEANLIGALRREKNAETALRKLEAEIEHVHRLACLREENAQRIKLILRFREEKIKQLELLVSGSLSTETYLQEENKILKEEIQVLQERIDKNPELTRFALENIRLLEQLQRFQNFYEHGEREALLAEISGFRVQLLDLLEQKHRLSSRYENQDNDMAKELEDCRNSNSKLMREIEELRTEYGKLLRSSRAAVDSVSNSFSKDNDEFRQDVEYSKIETLSIRSDSEDEVASYAYEDDRVTENKNKQAVNGGSITNAGDNERELIDARLLIEALETKQVQLINELQIVQEKNDKCMALLRNKDKEERQSALEPEHCCSEFDIPGDRNQFSVIGSENEMDVEVLQKQLQKLSKDLEETRLLNCQYQEDHASMLSYQHQVEKVREQVETETARTIVYLQEEVACLQSKLQESLYSMTQENNRLKNSVAAKEVEIRALSSEWERATVELTSFLLDGSKSLKDASNQIGSIVSSFPHVNICISEHVEKAIKVCIEKEETILHLQRSLEDAQNMTAGMELKLSTLKGATIALNELRLQDNNEIADNAFKLGVLLNERIHDVKMLENKLKLKGDQVDEAEKCSEAALLVVKWLLDSPNFSNQADTDKGFSIPELLCSLEVGGNMELEMRTDMNASFADTEVYIKAQLEMDSLVVLESKKALNASFADTEEQMAVLETDILQVCFSCTDMVHELAREIYEMRHEILAMKESHKILQTYTVKPQSTETQKSLNQSQCQMLHQIKDVLSKTNCRLNVIHDSINTKLRMSVGALKDEHLSEVDEINAECSTLGSEFSNKSVDLEDSLDELSFICNCSETIEQPVDVKFRERMLLEYDDQEFDKLKKHDQAVISTLRRELKMAFSGFNKLFFQLNELLNQNNSEDFSFNKEMKHRVLPLGLAMETVSCNSISEVVQKMDHVGSFFSKFEEAHAAIKEADLMLNALVKENKNAKQLNGLWRQTGEELILERASLMEELERIKSLVSLKGENELLPNQVHCTLEDMANSVSLLEDSFLQMQKETENTFEVLYSDIMSMGQEMLNFICKSRSSFEHMCSEIIEKGFALFVLCQCHTEKFVNQILKLNGGCVRKQCRQQGRDSLMNAVSLNNQQSIVITHEKGLRVEDPSEQFLNLGCGEIKLSYSNLIYENLSLKKELERKQVLLEGLLFDFSLLQESASNSKEIKDESEKLILCLSQVRQELEMQASQLDDALLQKKRLENCLNDTEKALIISNANVEQAKETIDTLSEQNAELRVILKDLYLQRTQAEESLEEQEEVIKGLEKEILHLTSSVEKKFHSSSEVIEDELRMVTSVRDKLLEEIRCLNDKLEMAYALADEKEAVAVEARQESEASKIYAEQKEEEVKILEHSVEELERTINVLEKKVYDVDGEVERHRLIRDSLELELQALRQRLSTVENFTDIVDTTVTNIGPAEDQVSRKRHDGFLELQESRNRICFLEREREELGKELKQCKEYISELILHSEAQASQYQQKYKTLESMVRGMKTDLPSSTSGAPTTQTSERSSTRTRGSSSPFRCIAGLVQQMNLEKDQELSTARLRIEELEALLSSRQKEVCMLNTSLAAAESMTHDVIRDLLGIKLDMTNYADMIDQHQVKKLVEEAYQYREEIFAKEQEILKLKEQINGLIEERESCVSERDKKELDILAAQISLEQLKERDQLLCAQNEMLKMDKANLKRRIIELDQMVKTLLETQTTQQQLQQNLKVKNDGVSKSGDSDLNKRLAHSEWLLSQVNDELAAHCRRSSNTHVRKGLMGKVMKQEIGGRKS